MSFVAFAELDKTTAPDRSRVENPANEAYPPVMPSFQTISSSFPDRTNQPSPTFKLEISVGRRVCNSRSIAERTALPVSLTHVPSINLTRSFPLDPTPPA